MSKESRRAARLARESRRAGAAGRQGAESGGQPGSAGTPGAAGPASGGGGRRVPAGTAGTRAGRRERPRRYHEPTFLERYRTPIVAVAAIAVVVLAIGWVFLGATAAAYTCSNTFDPSPTPTVSPGSSTRLGFVEQDMGRSHIVTPPQNYLYCPPASGTHYSGAGIGPIQPRVYGPSDKVGPTNWVHNLEHGAMVILYRNDGSGATTAGQQAFKQFYDSFPASPLCKIPPRTLSPVIARFDDMPHPFAALVWGRVLYMDTWDPVLALRFYNEESERLDANGDLVAPPEDVTQCGARLKASASPSAGASTGASAGPSAAPSVGGSPAAPASSGSAAPSAAPSASPAAS